ncbi:MAG: hypothetical protein A2W17_04480 [Planctomycetes bacterium RBG_16_41_13]|nr:MAG: hypothetical protein A2W17_04480 [Planctomycetes bacterium RBG_16_41_13]
MEEQKQHSETFYAIIDYQGYYYSIFKDKIAYRLGHSFMVQLAKPNELTMLENRLIPNELSFIKEIKVITRQEASQAILKKLFSADRYARVTPAHKQNQVGSTNNESLQNVMIEPELISKEKFCARCLSPYMPNSEKQNYCSNACRVAAHRKNKKELTI